jgi:DNA-binding XRE family transcriptional regulator
MNQRDQRDLMTCPLCKGEGSVERTRQRTEERLRLGTALRIARKRVGMTQQGLAAASGVSRNTIANAEIGRRSVTADALVALAEALGVE